MELVAKAKQGFSLRIDGYPSFPCLGIDIADDTRWEESRIPRLEFRDPGHEGFGKVASAIGRRLSESDLAVSCHGGKGQPVYAVAVLETNRRFGARFYIVLS